MIKSMTGYGRAFETIDGMDITVEIKSVNNKYFDFSSRTPRAYGFLDEKLKSFFQKSIERGKVDCFVQIAFVNSENAKINLNEALADAYVSALKEIAERYPDITNDVSVSLVSKYPDVLTACKDPDEENKIWSSVEIVAQKALDSFIEMRKTEGKKLYDDISSRCEKIIRCVEIIEEKSEETVKQYNEKLKARIRELLDGADVDEQRLLTEAAIFADKIAVAEETVRLRSHVDQMRTLLLADHAIGKKMDFLVQEMNREANTTGSKSQNLEITRTVIEIKAEIEKIREQVQNIE